MKDSGVSWVEEIPSDWMIKKMKVLFKFEKGKKSGIFTKIFVNDNRRLGEYPVYSGDMEVEYQCGLPSIDHWFVCT